MDPDGAVQTRTDETRRAEADRAGEQEVKGVSPLLGCKDARENNGRAKRYRARALGALGVQSSAAQSQRARFVFSVWCERPHTARYPPCTTKLIPAAKAVGGGSDPPSSRVHWTQLSRLFPQ